MKTIYLSAFYTLKPNERTNTNVKNWMKDESNISYDEQIAVTKNLKNRDLQMAGVILDLANRKVVRNRWENGRTFDELFSHYYSNYQKFLDPVISYLGFTATQLSTSTETLESKSETISST